MSANKLDTDFDPADWQWQDKYGQVFQINDMTRDDLIQVVCSCLAVLDAAEGACLTQLDIFHKWRTGRT